MSNKYKKMICLLLALPFIVSCSFFDKSNEMVVNSPTHPTSAYPDPFLPSGSADCSNHSNDNDQKRIELPFYLEKEIKDTIFDIQEFCGDDAFHSIAFFSDLHVYDYDDHQFNSLVDCLAYLETIYNIDCVINLGDNVNEQVSRKNHVSNSIISEYIYIVNHYLKETIQSPFFSINGNHDGIGCDFFDLAFWNAFTDMDDSFNTAYREQNKPYFYFDISNHYRLVFLSTPSGSDLNSLTVNWCFGREQLDWLSKIALDTPNDYSVLIFTHVPFLFEDKSNESIVCWDGQHKCVVASGELNGRLDDKEEFISILDSYQNHKKTGSYDFSNKERTAVLCCVSGHVHYDSLIYNTSDSFLPCPLITIGSNKYGTDGRSWENIPNQSSYRERTMRTSDEVLFDIAVFNKDAFATFRVGAGDDRVVFDNR